MKKPSKTPPSKTPPSKTPPAKWTAAQTALLIEKAGSLTDEQLAAALGKTAAATRKKRQRLGIRKANGRGRCIVVKGPAQELPANPPPANPLPRSPLPATIDLILAALPAAHRNPTIELAIEPAASATLEWYKDKNNLLTLILDYDPTSPTPSLTATWAALIRFDLPANSPADSAADPRGSLTIAIPTPHHEPPPAALRPLAKEIAPLLIHILDDIYAG